MAHRESMPEIRNEWLWTADFPMYRVENGEVVLYFAPREHNLIFRDIENATHQLITTGNYILSKPGIDEVVASAATGITLKIKISDLQLQKENRNDADGYFDVDKDNLDSLNPAQKSFVQAVYGNSKLGNRVYVLTLEYVKETLKGKEDRAIARASGLGRADDGSWFNAVSRYVDLAGDGLLGVLKEASEAPQKIEGAATVPIIPTTKYTPEGIITYLNKTPVDNERLAATLLKSANDFYQRRIK